MEYGNPTHQEYLPVPQTGVALGFEQLCQDDDRFKRMLDIVTRIKSVQLNNAWQPEMHDEIAPVVARYETPDENWQAAWLDELRAETIQSEQELFEEMNRPVPEYDDSVVKRLLTELDELVPRLAKEIYEREGLSREQLPALPEPTPQAIRYGGITQLAMRIVEGNYMPASIEGVDHVTRRTEDGETQKIRLRQVDEYEFDDLFMRDVGVFGRLAESVQVLMERKNITKKEAALRAVERAEARERKKGRHAK